jgi:hypothetical protein
MCSRPRHSTEAKERIEAALKKAVGEYAPGLPLVDRRRSVTLSDSTHTFPSRDREGAIGRLFPHPASPARAPLIGRREKGFGPEIMQSPQ